MARLIHYVLVLVGFMIALSALGFDLKNITILGGAQYGSYLQPGH